MGNTKDVSTIVQGMVAGSRCQAHRFVSRTANLLVFPRSILSRVYQEWSTTQRTTSQLDTTVGSIRVNMVQRLCRMLLTPCRDELRMLSLYLSVSLFASLAGRCLLNNSNVQTSRLVNLAPTWPLATPTPTM